MDEEGGGVVMSSRRWQTKAMSFAFRLAALSALAVTAASAATAERPRAREAGISIGILAPGPLNVALRRMTRST